MLKNMISFSFRRGDALIKIMAAKSAKGANNETKLGHAPASGGRSHRRDCVYSFDAGFGGPLRAHGGPSGGGPRAAAVQSRFHRTGGAWRYNRGPRIGPAGFLSQFQQLR